MPTYDIIISQGNDFNLLGTYKDSDGNVIDMSSMSISGAIYEDYDCSTPIAEITCTISSPTSGGFEFYIPESVTSNFQGSKCVNASQATSHLGVYITDLYTSTGKKRFLEGKVKLNRRPSDRNCGSC